MQYFYVFFYKSKGYPVDQKFDMIEKNRGHFRIQRPNVSQNQVPDLSQHAQIVFPSVITRISRPEWNEICFPITGGLYNWPPTLSFFN